ncbi:MAG: hypothetical protein ACFFER_17590, partial [Candidatus Thorarchaeota archaeon]
EGQVQIAFSSSISKPNYFELKDGEWLLDGKLLSTSINNDSLVKIDVRFEISAEFNHISLVRGWCRPQFKWAVSLMEEFWL